MIFGAGYVGSAVAHEAVTRGMRVTALTRNAEKAEVLRAAGATIVVADLADAGWHEQIGGGVEFVLNCVSSGGGGMAGYERSYRRGMESILAWARARGAAGTVVYTSSTSVYPQGGGVRVDETAPTDGRGERAKVLVGAEGVLHAANDTGACQRWFVLRLAGIYGPGRHQLLEQVRVGEVAGRGDDHLNLIHLDDICGAVWAAFGAPALFKNEIFNVADDGAATKTQITAWLAAQLGVAEPRFTGEPAARRRAVTPDRIISNVKLRTVLGWRARFPSFREGYATILSA